MLLAVLYRFSLSFGADAGYPGFIGKPETYGLFHNVGAAPEPSLAPTIPLTVFALYQLMFAIITPTLIIGSFAERVNFPALCLFVFFWHTLVYCPLAHMTWHPQGLLRMFGVLDFAGKYQAPRGPKSNNQCSVFDWYSGLSRPAEVMSADHPGHTTWMYAV